MSRSTTIAMASGAPEGIRRAKRPPSTWSPRSSRTRSASRRAPSARAAARSIGRRRRARPRPAGRLLEGATRPRRRRTCEGSRSRSASSAASPISRLSTTETAAATAPGTRGGRDVGEVVRATGRRRGRSCVGEGQVLGARRTSARTRGGVDGDDASPAPRSRRATWPHPRRRRPRRAPAHSTSRSRGPSRCASLAGRPRRGRPRRSPLTGATPPARRPRASSPRRRGGAGPPRSASAAPPRRSCRRAGPRSGARWSSGRARPGSRARPRRSA